jgi:hypothetical protein
LRPQRCFNRLRKRKLGLPVMPAKLVASLVVLSVTLLSAQNAPKTLAFINTSDALRKDITKALAEKCADVTVTEDPKKGDYTLEVARTTTRYGLGIEKVDHFELTLSDREGNTVSAMSDTSFKFTTKGLCKAIKSPITIEVVDATTLTESMDARSQGIVGALTGRRTHTDNSSIYVIVNGEHALLDCYERRTGCATIGPGKYYGVEDGDGIWVSHRMPITHKLMRDHYKVAGSW